MVEEAHAPGDIASDPAPMPTHQMSYLEAAHGPAVVYEDEGVGNNVADEVCFEDSGQGTRLTNIV